MYSADARRLAGVEARSSVKARPKKCDAPAWICKTVSQLAPRSGEKKNRWKNRAARRATFFPLPHFFPRSENHRPVVLASSNAGEVSSRRFAWIFLPGIPTSRNSFLRLLFDRFPLFLFLPSHRASSCATTRLLCGAACNNVYLIFLPVLSMGVIGDEF